MTGLRERPLRLEQAMTVDYINRAQKMREIEQWGHEQKWRGWRLAVVWLLCLGLSIGAWVYVIWLGL